MATDSRVRLHVWTSMDGQFILGSWIRWLETFGGPVVLEANTSIPVIDSSSTYVNGIARSKWCVTGVACSHMVGKYYIGLHTVEGGADYSGASLV